MQTCAMLVHVPSLLWCADADLEHPQRLQIMMLT